MQDAITDKDGFGEQPENQWTARQRPNLMVELIKQWQGDAFAKTAQVEKLLTDAIELCDQRNLLAHGNWWCFNRRTLTIVVRGPTRWEGTDIPPKQRAYTADNIHEVAERLAEIEIELHRLRRSIDRPSEAEGAEH